jgi:sugar lactone lactonase YvrE
VLRFPIDAPGRLGAPRVFADISALEPSSRFRTAYAERGPDGLEFGPDGSLYVAIYGEGRLLRFSPSGALIGEIEVAPRYVTNVAFGENGARAIVGAFRNDRAPFRGEVRIDAPD